MYGEEEIADKAYRADDRPDSVSIIQTELEQQQKVLADLEDIAGSLTVRLRPVLSPVEEGLANETKERAAYNPGYHVVESLRQSNDRLRRLSAILKDTSKRLEV
jgi:hypothetical protein